MVLASNLGFPRIGPKRQLKTSLESFWNGKSSEDDLLAAAREIRLNSITLQCEKGLDHIPSNDFSFYDHVLDTIAMVGAVPKRFGWATEKVDLATYFAMARGASGGSNGNSISRPAMEMTKWFNTNYHFIVPELEPDQQFKLATSKCIDEFIEAKELGVTTRPVLLGPITFLYLAKYYQREEDSTMLRRLLEVYSQVLSALKCAGAEWVQLDEPCLALDLNERTRQSFREAYAELSQCGLSILLASYFGPMKENLAPALELPINAIHLDLVQGLQDLEPALSLLPKHISLSAGVIDGHNIWRCNLVKTADLLEDIGEKIGPERLIVAPSCSLLHVPIDVQLERHLDSELKSWLAFANQKIEEISWLTDALCCGRKEVEQIFLRTSEVVERYKNSSRRLNPVVSGAVNAIKDDMCKRQSGYDERARIQKSKFQLPLLPTTTIGSFPQTKEIREGRKRLRAKEITVDQYEEAMQSEIRHNVALQEKIGIDVFVHGEPERTDMVEFFADQLTGYLVTQNGWVQSYGSRCVRPPIIYGDISRPLVMTVKWAKFAQSLTQKPVKGMLTGPVTMLQWSFVRNDQPLELTCSQLALAIRQEVQDLESAGISIIQIDEPAIREGLPLRRADWNRYFRWAIKCFRLSSCGVSDDTQIHTHMCYSEFGDMVQSIVEMDADVISIEAARSRMDLLYDLQSIRYPNEIGPGVFDIHSPLVPSAEEIEALLQKALKVIPAARLWVNPDCGLKTRSWQEVIPALNNLVQATASLRAKLAVANGSM